jgi:hypothetical protein
MCASTGDARVRVVVGIERDGAFGRSGESDTPHAQGWRPVCPIQSSNGSSSARRSEARNIFRSSEKNRGDRIMAKKKAKKAAKKTGKKKAKKKAAKK